MASRGSVCDLWCTPVRCTSSCPSWRRRRGGSSGASLVRYVSIVDETIVSHETIASDETIVISPGPVTLNLPWNHCGLLRTPWRIPARTRRTREPSCHTRSFTRLTRHNDTSLCIVRFVKGGDHRAVRTRAAGRARLREAINSRLDEAGFQTALVACAAAFLLIVTAVTTALLVSGHGTAGGQGTAADMAPSFPAGTSAVMPAASPRTRATAVPSASPAAPDPAVRPTVSRRSPSWSARPTVPVRSPSPSARPTVPVGSPSPSATGSPSSCPPGLARHHRCQ